MVVLTGCRTFVTGHENNGHAGHEIAGQKERNSINRDCVAMQFFDVVIFETRNTLMHCA